MATLFEKAKNKEAKKVVEKHEVVEIPEIASELAQLVKLNKEIAEKEAQRAILDAKIREDAKESMVSLYNKTKKFPGTLKIKAGKYSFQFITSDKYKKVDEDQYNFLKKTYGKELVEEITTYSFNTEILEKHMDHISDLLMKSTKMSDDDKANLLQSITSYSIKKNVIKELFSFVKDKINNIIEDIQPAFFVKSVKAEDNA